MENDKEELLKELMAVEILIKENPCKMPNGLLNSLKDVLNSFIGKQCLEGASREQVACYLKRDLRTIHRWQKDYPDFPKSTHHGHKEVSFNWLEVVQWKIKHKELYNS